MSFQFPLDTLLRFRRSIEHQQELLLLEASQRVAVLQHKIEEVDRAVAAFSARELRELTVGLSAAELHFEVQCGRALVQRRSILEKELTQAEKFRDERRTAYQHARRTREVVDTLRDHQLQIYRQQEERTEQRRLDDLFLLRREFLRHR